MTTIRKDGEPPLQAALEDGPKDGLIIDHPRRPLFCFCTMDRKPITAIDFFKDTLADIDTPQVRIETYQQESSFRYRHVPVPREGDK